MKKLLALLLALTLVFSLTACATKTPEPVAPPADTEQPTDAEKPADAEKTEDPAKAYKIAMVCDSSISDGGWGAACFNAMKTAAEAGGWTYEYTDSIAQSDYVNSITAYCQLGFDLVFLPGNQYSDAAMQVAKDYPEICFAVLNGAEDLPTDNITSILPNADQIGWMAGALAGLMTESNVLGFIGAMEIDTTKAKLAGFEAAAKVVNPAISVKSAYTGSFSDTAKGMELATNMISEKADVFFGDASAVDSGARQAIDTANAAGAIKIFDIGQPADLFGQNPCVITSVVTDNAGMLRLAMDSVVDGTFGNTVIYGSLENNCLSVGQFNDELVSKEIQEEYLGYIDQMTAGTFKVG